MKEKILRAIYETIEEVNGQLKESRRIAKSPEAPLAEPDGPLTSLGMVNFVVTLEQNLEDSLQREYSLISEQTLAGKESPFRDVKRLVEYVEQLSSSPALP